MNIISISKFQSQIKLKNMASLHASPMASHSVGDLRRPSAAFHSHSLISVTPRHNLKPQLNLRSRKEVRLPGKNRWSPAFASNSNPSDGLDDTKSNDTAPGPPFLTILVGVLVFLFVCWIIGSIVMWFIGLILNPPPLK